MQQTGRKASEDKVVRKKVRVKKGRRAERRILLDDGVQD